MTTEEETFNTLRRIPISPKMLDMIDPDECSVEEFQHRINIGLYDKRLTELGWNQTSFYSEYSKWIDKTLRQMHPHEYE